MTMAPQIDTTPLSPSRYIALVVAWTATIGSLFLSEVLNFIPCTLCWYQRILMYPLSVIITIGILRRDNGIHHTVLPLAVPGFVIALYHYLLIKTDWLPPPPCLDGVPCNVDYLNIFGFINIPFMSLTAFFLIIVMMLASRHEPFDEPTNIEGVAALTAREAWLTYALIAVVFGFFVVLAQVIA